MQPVQIQNLLAWIAGEMEVFDAIATSLGLGVRTTYESKKTPAKGESFVKFPTVKFPEIKFPKITF